MDICSSEGREASLVWFFVHWFIHTTTIHIILLSFVCVWEEEGIDWLLDKRSLSPSLSSLSLTISWSHLEPPTATPTCGGKARNHKWSSDIHWFYSITPRRKESKRKGIDFVCVPDKASDGGWSHRWQLLLVHAIVNAAEVVVLCNEDWWREDVALLLQEVSRSRFNEVSRSVFKKGFRRNWKKTPTSNSKMHTQKLSRIEEKHKS